MNRKPAQSEHPAILAAAARGVRFIRLDDGPWAWTDGSTGNSGFPTELAAARNALNGSNACRA